MSINYHKHGIETLNSLYDEYQNNYNQLRQLTYMILGASFMLAPASPEAQELDTFSQKVEARISVLLGVDKWMQSA